MYPLRFPFSGVLGSWGIPLSIVIKCAYDKEAKVFVATSPDVPGLMVEASSIDELRTETFSLIPELLELNLGIHLSKHQDVRLKEQLHLSAI